MAEKTYYIVRGKEKVQIRDSKGHFLPKRVKYVTKSCPKAEYSRQLDKAKLFSSFPKANYALFGINKVSEKLYDFDIVPVNVNITVNE